MAEGGQPLGVVAGETLGPTQLARDRPCVLVEASGTTQPDPGAPEVAQRNVGKLFRDGASPAQLVEHGGYLRPEEGRRDRSLPCDAPESVDRRARLYDEARVDDEHGSVAGALPANRGDDVGHRLSSCGPREPLRQGQPAAPQQGREFALLDHVLSPDSARG